jgi:hypothetical protein
MAIDLSFEFSHSFTTRHQACNFPAGLFPFPEISSLTASDQHREMIAYG